MSDKPDNIYSIFRNSQSLGEGLEQRFQSRDGGGNDGGMFDEWKNSVDSQLGQLHQDVRNLLYGLLASFILLGGAGFTLYKGLADGQAQLRADLVRLEGKIETMNAAQNGKLDILLERSRGGEASEEGRPVAR